MSHSTHGGFNGPPATIAKVSEFRANSLGDAALSLHMRATGVGHIFTAVRKPKPAFVPSTGLFVLP